MSQERGGFRRRFFGGFDRTDVINYIENISVQRNRYQAEAQKYAAEAEELRSKLASLTKELNENNTKQNSIQNELREAQDELETVKGQLDHKTKELAALTQKYENDISAAQNALSEAVKNGKQQRELAVNTASQIVSDLREKYEGTKTDIDTAFRDAETKLSDLLKNKEN